MKTDAGEGPETKDQFCSGLTKNMLR